MDGEWKSPEGKIIVSIRGRGRKGRRDRKTKVRARVDLVKDFKNDSHSPSSR